MIADRIKSRRIELGLTQKDIANRLNVTFQTVSKYERGVNIPDSDVLYKLSTILNCTADYLIGKTDNPDSNVYTHDDVLIELSKAYPYELTPNEVDKLVKLLKEYKFDIESLIDDVKKGIVK